ncbi:acetolactate decarboxylase [Streptomyces sp. NPDC060030]|uniref:acetolactate decarboxylase n=1 Tax=Streptomyces sp. NPDC060030 TaxID=3347042 RepID=UPI003676D0A9
MGTERLLTERIRGLIRPASSSGRHQGAGRTPELGREVYQNSIMAALIDGVYDGDVAVEQLLERGDFGVGTFNHLNGEMLVLDGTCFHLSANGRVETARKEDLSPFSVMVRFAPDEALEVPTPMDRPELTQLIDDRTRGPNLIYSVRVDGNFSEVRTRTVREQSAPYPPLIQASADQAETVFTGLQGTLAGFRTPEYLQGISVAGYHLHFIDELHTRGGHCLDFRILSGTVSICEHTALRIRLPAVGKFLDADLSSPDLGEQIRDVEGR